MTQSSAARRVRIVHYCTWADQLEDAAAYLPSGHRFSIPGVYLRLEAGRVVARRERISLTQH